MMTLMGYEMMTTMGCGDDDGEGGSGDRAARVMMKMVWHNDRRGRFGGGGGLPRT